VVSLDSINSDHAIACKAANLVQRGPARADARQAQANGCPRPAIEGFIKSPLGIWKNWFLPGVGQVNVLCHCEWVFLSARRIFSRSFVVQDQAAHTLLCDEGG
jgi:hypothetical protein